MTKTALKNSMIKGKFVIANDRGLHTRPSTELVKCSTSFKARIHLTYQKQTVNGKSLLGVLMLGAPRGARIYVEAEGEDASEALQAILMLAKQNFYIDY